MKNKIDSAFNQPPGKIILNEAIDSRYKGYLCPEMIKIIDKTHPELIKDLVNLHHHHPYSFEHSLAVANMAILIAEKYDGLTEIEKEILKKGSLTHDLGKLDVDNKILDKNTGLTDNEFIAIKKHPEAGYKKIYPFDPAEAELSLDHHKFQKNSYPEGKPGTNKKISRIIAIIDSFHTAAFGRNYQKALPLSECRQALENKFTEPDDKKIISILIDHFEAKY